MQASEASTALLRLGFIDVLFDVLRAFQICHAFSKINSSGCRSIESRESEAARCMPHYIFLVKRTHLNLICYFEEICH